jgi:hypothetical protein
VTVENRGCAWNLRTLGLTFGDHIEVKNKGPAAVLPQLIGAPTVALVAAIPGGQAVPLIPRKMGQYALVDRSHDFTQANVYVLAYPTHAVTGLDGKFSIQGLPVGKAKLTAFLPVFGKPQTQEIEVVADQPLEVTLTLPFSEQDYDASKVDRERPAASAEPAPAK